MRGNLSFHLPCHPTKGPGAAQYFTHRSACLCVCDDASRVDVAHIEYFGDLVKAKKRCFRDGWSATLPTVWLCLRLEVSNELDEYHPSVESGFKVVNFPKVAKSSNQAS